jgi:AraC family transcriptional regulator of adaptative response/methylated-DNA-[protein]-cysteine methyltransferase
MITDALAAPRAAESAPGPVRFSVGQSTLGHVLVAETDEGVRAVLIGDSIADLQRDLRRRFPGAESAPARADLVESVIDYIEHPATADEPPLDIAGTPFQREVWRALREVPAGETTTYAELARRIGRPSAVRAVAGAVAANPVAVLVPCHRVIRSDGSLSGYRWGVERKRELLAREKWRQVD